MRKWIVRAVALIIALILLAGLIMPAMAAEETAQTTAADTENFIAIHTVEELQAMGNNPTGSYILAEDLDMTGVEWKPVDFEGIFDGNGHAILNLNLTQLGDTTGEVLDGNRKAYEASFTGLFGTLKIAQVRNLRLINVRSVFETDVPCFMGGIAGYSMESQIENCGVSGVLELRAYNQIFGLGGVVGYGSGAVRNCTVKVSLICVDTDSTTKDEQFLGGVYSTGFMDVEHCAINIEGFVSEHGYAHNGGITGMYMQNPLGLGKIGSISYNTVSGRIKFFEDNRDRRAYCDAYAGEVLANRYVLLDNRRDFVRDEVRKYDQEIRPCMCETPDIREYTVYSNCAKKSYGHSNWECWNCGYEENYDYMMLTHTVTNWELVEAPTLEKEGLSVGTCDICGIERTQVEPMLVPETEPETEPTVAEDPVPTASSEEMETIQAKLRIFLVILIVAMALLLGIAGYLVFALVRSGRK